MACCCTVPQDLVNANKDIKTYSNFRIDPAVINTLICDSDFFSGIAGEDRGQLLPDMSQRMPVHTNSVHWQGKEGKIFEVYWAREAGGHFKLIL